MICDFTVICTLVSCRVSYLRTQLLQDTFSYFTHTSKHSAHSTYDFCSFRLYNYWITYFIGIFLNEMSEKFYFLWKHSRSFLGFSYSVASFGF